MSSFFATSMQIGVASVCFKLSLFIFFETKFKITLIFDMIKHAL